MIPEKKTLLVIDPLSDHGINKNVEILVIIYYVIIFPFVSKFCTARVYQIKKNIYFLQFFFS